MLHAVDPQPAQCLSTLKKKGYLPSANETTVTNALETDIKPVAVRNRVTGKG